MSGRRRAAGDVDGDRLVQRARLRGAEEDAAGPVDEREGLPDKGGVLRHARLEDRDQQVAREVQERGRSRCVAARRRWRRRNRSRSGSGSWSGSWSGSRSSGSSEGSSRSGSGRGGRGGRASGQSGGGGVVVCFVHRFLVFDAYANGARSFFSRFSFTKEEERFSKLACACGGERERA